MMKHSRALLLMCILLFTAGTGVSQPPLEEWVATYDGQSSAYDCAYDIALDSTGNVYITGSTEHSLNGYDYTTVKYDPDGNEEWAATYDGPAHDQDEAFSIALDSSGNVYVTGYCIDIGSNYNFGTVKYDTNGNQKWVATYNGIAEGTDAGIAIAVNAEGIVGVTGVSEGVGTGYDYTTIRYDSGGNEQWVARFNGAENGSDWPSSIALDEDGNVYVTGYSFGTVSTDFLTIMYNSDGEEKWTARYNGPADEGDNPNAIAVDESGNVFVLGTSVGTVSYQDFVTIKYDAFGSEQWVARYDGPGGGMDLASAIALDNEGNVFVTGTSSGSGTDDDYATIKYDSLGTEQWVARYDSPAGFQDYSYDIAVDYAGNVYVTGCTTNSSDYYDITTIMYDNNGVEQWVISYDGPQSEDDEGYAIAVDDNGNVYVTGYGTGIVTECDYTTIKYSQTVGIESPEEPVGLNLFPVSPNPSSAMFTISYCIPEATETRIGIYSISGRLISEVEGDEQNPGLYQVQMECMASGLYFCRLETETESLTESFVIIR